MDLQPIYLVLIFSSINYLLTTFGAALVFFIKKNSHKLVTMSLGGAAGIMVAASFFSLLLPALESVGENRWLQCLIPLGFITGVFFLKVSDHYIPHASQVTKSNTKGKLILLAMTLHNIPEGFAVGVAFAGAINHYYIPAIILSIGIGIQNIPEGTAISLPLYNEGLTRFRSFFYGQASAFVEIPAALIGFLFASLTHSILPFCLSLAAGAMMFVCIEELIPEANASKDVDIGTMSFMVGFLLMMTLDILLS